MELEDQRHIFKIRSKTNHLPLNCETVLCEPACGQTLSIEHILSCNILNDQEAEEYTLDLIYSGNVEKKLKVLNSFRKNVTKRQKYLPKDS